MYPYLYYKLHIGKVIRNYKIKEKQDIIGSGTANKVKNNYCLRCLSISPCQNSKSSRFVSLYFVIFRLHVSYHQHILVVPTAHLGSLSYRIASNSGIFNAFSVVELSLCILVFYRHHEYNICNMH